MVKKLVLVAALAMAVCMVGQTLAFAQTVGEDIYWVNYFANRNNTAGFDQAVNITNPGVQGSPLSANEGELCANIYVFAADQQMTECCSCPITADGLLTLSLNSNLTGNPMTSVSPSSGMIKLVSSSGTGGACDPTALSAVTGSSNVEPDLRAWESHLVQTTPGTLFTTETSFAPAPLGADEAAFLPYTCRFVQYLGSGKGVCTCGP
jgi:hypothetical protein